MRLLGMMMAFLSCLMAAACGLFFTDPALEKYRIGATWFMGFSQILVLSGIAMILYDIADLAVKKKIR